ncbi:hypothetical protein CAPTEDRAFT_200352 [Capitella teleta]|uniref:LRRCT domain-containing protein n=1 Tax=Capitella teleta TaxID=283909 RepID=R7UZV6_CAPTE|nr:hypothetical protein CAPTEDRAFT_200352 [Capitella teleta]|eukprot:ELU09482.1 hypothetical protein CAPTEDRAFT_200352 [Capitella teleta]
MEAALVLVIIAGVHLPDYSDCTVIERDGWKNLTDYVVGLPHDLTELNLDNNLITGFVFPAGYSFVTHLSAMSNLLTELPDVRNIGKTLIDLRVHKNRISVINSDILDSLKVLELLHLGENLLVHFPDVSYSTPPALLYLKLYFNLLIDMPYLPNLGKSVKQLQIGNSPISHIPLKTMLVLKKLETLGGKNISAPVLPNLCHVALKAPRKLKLQLNTKLSCDCHFRWVKLLNSSSVELDAAPCHASPALNGLPVDQIGVDQLECAGRVQLTENGLKRVYTFQAVQMLQWTYCLYSNWYTCTHVNTIQLG